MKLKKCKVKIIWTIMEMKKIIINQNINCHPVIFLHPSF